MDLERTVYSVSDVNQYVKAIISRDENLKFILVKGEISNFKCGAGGHLYFSLKDAKSLINVVMFSTYATRLAFSPKNGDEVVAFASVDVYPARGSYQLVCYELNPVGEGTILVELEKLKKKLQSEGLFDASRKREINLYPTAIGVITARNSAAIKDILTNIKRRYPLADIYVFYSAVQGDAAPKELLKAFMTAQEYNLDTLIIGRGGGASEDLGAFNDETLVRAISKSKMPVIAAVGHEIDTTLVDYVADKRASTPTGAAELATVDRREIEQHFQYCLDDMRESIIDKLNVMKENVSDLSQELKDVMGEHLDDLSQELTLRSEQLKALNPQKILQRGYSISMDEDGRVIADISNLQKGSRMTTIIKNGKIISTIEDTEENQK